MLPTTVDAFRFAARRLRKAPGFTAVAVLTLALGIGANTAIFSVINGVLLRPTPHVHEPDRLVQVYTSDFSGPPFGSSSYPDYRDLREGVDAFSRVAAYAFRPVNLTVGDETREVGAEVVSGDYFSTLGVESVAGGLRLPTADDAASTALVAVIGHGLWQRRFGGDAGVVGRTARVNGRVVTVVGVAPEGFTGVSRPFRAELWMPVAHAPDLFGSGLLDRRGSRWLGLVARLTPASSVLAAQAQLDVLAAQLHRAHPSSWTNVRDEPRRLTAVAQTEARVPPAIRGGVVGFMTLLGGVVGLVLLVACANVANLVLVRAVRRRREIAVRLSLGASRGRIVRQLLSESVLLALIAGVAGVLLGVWLTELLAGFRPSLPLPLDLEFGLDTRVLGFALGLTFATGIVFGLVPALRASRPDLVSTLKEGGRGAARGRRFDLRRSLVVAQVAVSLVLVIGAGLFVRSLREASAIDPGFDPDGVLLATLPLGSQGYSPDRGRTFHAALIERVQGLPGVESAVLAEMVPLTLAAQRSGIQVEDYEAAPGEEMEFDFNAVGAGYFHTLRVPLLGGRGFTEADGDGAPPVVVVNDAFAERFWPGGDAVGRRIDYRGGEWAEVVGVVRTGKLRRLGEQPRPAFYAPVAQAYADRVTLHVRTAGGDPLALLPAVRREVRALDADLPIINPAMLREAIGVSLLPQRMAGTLLSGFGALALALAMVGLYGVMAYAVARRTREVGIRMALGAPRSRVLRGVVAEGAGLAGTGLAVGLLLALGASRLAGAFLFGISATDPVSFAGAGALLLAVALLASYLPARRAAYVDPMDALRHE